MSKEKLAVIACAMVALTACSSGGGDDPLAAITTVADGGEPPQSAFLDDTTASDSVAPDPGPLADDQCRSDIIRLAVVVPEGWECRALTAADGGGEGLTLVSVGSELNIVIGTPSPFGPPCEVLGVCDQAVSEVYSANFPNTTRITIGGSVTVWGQHATAGAEVVATKPGELTPEDTALISAVLDSVVTF
ncbi:MAG: hypothetical protein AAGD35_07830 [Actinomycetota bacterium]